MCLEAQRAGGFVDRRGPRPVEPEVRTALADAGMLGTKVWMFDQDVGRVAGAQPRHRDHPRPAHRGRRVVGRATTDAARAVRASSPAARRPRTDVLVAAHRAIAAEPARLVLATVDDLAGSTVRPNSPGTEGEHNWCHRLPAPAVDLLARSPGAEIVAAMSGAPPVAAPHAAGVDIDGTDVGGVTSAGCARGGTRTHTPLRTTDFESVASAIPPLGRVTGRAYRSRSRRLGRSVAAPLARLAGLR